MTQEGVREGAVLKGGGVGVDDAGIVKVISCCAGILLSRYAREVSSSVPPPLKQGYELVLHYFGIHI